jgi:DnaJ-class molecular chaperone
MVRKSKERQQPEKSEGEPCFSCRGEGRIWDHVCPSCKGTGRKPSYDAGTGPLLT